MNMETIIYLTIATVGSFAIGCVWMENQLIKKHTKKIQKEIEEMKNASHTCYMRDEVELTMYEYGI